MYTRNNKLKRIAETRQYNLPFKPTPTDKRVKSVYAAERDDSYINYQPVAKETELYKVANEHLVVLELDQYVELEGVLTKKMEIITDNIRISKEKNMLKDKEIQIIAQSIDKLIAKIAKLQAKMNSRQKKLSKVSIKCHDLTQITSKEQQNIKKQTILLHEETGKCTNLNEDITHLQSKIEEMQRELQRRKRIDESYANLEEKNYQLKQRLSQLENQEQMLQYRDSNQKKEYAELQNKISHLQTVLKDRSKINKKNTVKVSHLSRQISNLEESNSLKMSKLDEMKNLQLQAGQLYQQLLLLNEDISQLQFKIQKKARVIEDLKNKVLDKSHQQSINSSNQHSKHKKQSFRILQSEEDQNQNIRKSKRNTLQVDSNGKNQLPLHSKNVSPMKNARNNYTPTFTANEANLGIESGNNNIKLVDESNGGEAFKNIQKLINRFEQIKNKDKSKQF